MHGDRIFSETATQVDTVSHDVAIQTDPVAHDETPWWDSHEVVPANERVLVPQVAPPDLPETETIALPSISAPAATHNVYVSVLSVCIQSPELKSSVVECQRPHTGGPRRVCHLSDDL